jgi:molybdopterin-containing oxidoreductase family membrane subunit
MSKKWAFDDKETFLHKLESLVAEGVSPELVETITPFHVHETDHILHTRTSRLRFFTLTGALTGLIGGFAFTIFTVLDWPLITAGKPLISLPPFLVIAFELTILFGGLLSLVGFLALARFPSLKAITVPPEETGNQFVILVHEEE